MSEFEELSGRLTALIDGAESEALYGESFRIIKKEIDNIKGRLTSGMQDVNGDAR